MLKRIFEDYNQSAALKAIGRIFKFFIPFGIWVFIFGGFLTGESSVVGDGHIIYGLVTYFIKNIIRGDFPLWNPFVVWGVPDLVGNNFFGIFNPIWWLVFILHKIGISYYFSYLYTNVIFFFFGMMGFYSFAKAFLKDNLGAYLSFLMMFFAMQCVFENFATISIIYVPMVWFFYCWLRLCETQKPKFFVGLIFCLMVIASSYFPPYWLMVFFFVIFTTFVCDFKFAVNSVASMVTFSKKNFILIFVCFSLLGVTLVPVWRAFAMSKNKEVVFHDRHPQGEDALSKKGGEMNPDELLSDSFDSKSFLSQHFSNNLYFRGWWSDYILIPFFVVIIFLLGAFNRITRKSFTLLLMLILLYFLLLGPPGKMYAVFYKVLPMFKVIHSFSSFWPAFVGIFVLFTTLQWRTIIKEQFVLSQRGIFWVLFAAHLAVLAFLFWQKNTIASFYITIFLSFIYFCSEFFFKNKIYRWLSLLILFVCVSIQPLQGMWHYRGDPFNDKSYAIDYIFPPSDGFLFRYVRPDYEGIVNSRSHIRHLLQMRDFISYVGNSHFPCWWTAYLFENLPKETVEEYVKYKFYIYDKGRALSGKKEEDLDLVKKVFQEDLNLALVAQEDFDDDLNFLQGSSKVSQKAKIVKGPSQELSVTHFDTNSIVLETNFDTKKFLVYNDSYHKDWKLFFNGNPTKIYRANIAFKGIVLPAGKNVMRLVYSPLGGAEIYVLILCIFNGMFLWVIFLFIKDLKYFNRSRQKL
ncbi:MAG: YfhO family protein [Candidatus Aceula meridiana]|nr:YfhO family protein [Candidatus Aceula meridiana]